MNYLEVNEGHAAHKRGLGISDNPHAIDCDYLKANRWLAGYIQSQAVTKPTTSGNTAHMLRLLVDLVILAETTEVQDKLIEFMHVLSKG